MSAHLATDQQVKYPAFLDNHSGKVGVNPKFKRAGGKLLPSTLIPPLAETLIPTPIFLLHRTSKALQGMSCRHPDSVRKARLFLISKESNAKARHKPKRVKNRKLVSYSGLITLGGNTYRINGKAKRGIYLSMLHKAINQLDICQKKWSRVLVIRCDLHQRFYRTDNHKVSNFIDNFKRRLQRQYGFDDIGYFWCREHGRAKAQHYHCVIYLDGNKIRHSSKVLRIVKGTWEGCGRHIKPGNHVPVIKNPFYFVDSEVTKANAIYRISYLCKERDKGYHDHYVNDYGASRLTPKWEAIHLKAD